MRSLTLAMLSAAMLLQCDLATADPTRPDSTQPVASAPAPAVSATTAATTTGSPATTAAARPEVVKVKPQPTADNLYAIECRSSPPPTGTRLGATRECHTVHEWNERQQDSQDKLQLTQEHALMGLAGPPGK
ncbi:MAG TPA: hypothetical protein VHY79_00060 [Rhizomicrobium sp.]|jgi:hypothetical protein|nr:hypothetical protein [Rhizomicrobium sp.]